MDPNNGNITPDTEADDSGDLDLGEDYEALVASAFDELDDGEDADGETDEIDGDGESTPEGEQAAGTDQADSKAAPASTPKAEQAGQAEYWSDEVKQRFAQLPKDAQALVQDIVKDQTADFTRKSQEVAQMREAAQGVFDAIGPYKANFDAAGIHPVQGIEMLLRTENTLRNGSPEQKAQMLHQLASSYGVSLPSMNQDEDGDDYDADPSTAPLRKQLAQTKAELNTLRAQFDQIGQREAQQQRAQVQSSIQAFIDAKDEAGNLKHPHVDKVHKPMAALLRANRGMSIEDAYAAAVAADPSLRSETINAAVQAEIAKRSGKAKQVAGDPRANVTGQRRDGRTGRFVPTTGDDFEAIVTEAFEHAQAGG